jgi:fructose-specific phosphotransferase system IIC component
MSTHHTSTSFVRSLQSGIIAGFIATAIGNFLGLVTHGISQTYYVETSISAVTVAAMSIGVIAGILYHFLRQMSSFSRDILTIFGLTLPTIISILVLTNNYYDTVFKVIAITISYAVVLTTVILVPWLTLRTEQYSSTHAHHHKKAAHHSKK